MNRHFDLIGILFLAIGAIGMVTGLLVLLGVGALALGVGGLATLAEGLGAGVLAGGTLGLIAVAAAGLTFLVSLPSVIAGRGLMMRRPWAPAVALVLCLFHLFSFPLGTALAVYTAWALLSEDGNRAWELAVAQRRRLTG